MKKPSLNHVYRLIWNTQLQSFVPMAETTAACGKRAIRASALCVGALLSITPLAQALDPGALPTDGQVVAGSANIAQTANQMTVTQHTDRMVAQWSSFNIGEQAQVQFQQPNAASIALNRVINSNPSEILGSLSANGQVYLINPNGILFGRTAQVNVGGIVASTLDMSDADFLNANRTLSFTGNNGRVENLGALNATSVIALIAPEASNSGTLKVDNGSALIAAGNQVNLDFSGDGLVTVKVNQAAFNALAENKGLIQADGGLVMMTAQSANALMDTVVNHEGLIQANTLVNKNGRIILEGGDTGVTHLTGEIHATGNTGGDVIVTGNKVGLFNDAHINVNGQFGGGNIFIGGGQEGADPSIHNAKAVHISQDSTLSADATEFGKGGTLIAYSTDSTQMHGHLSARGGSDGGDGGFIETSGGWLDISKAPNTSSALGNAGTWLIDPNNITIASGFGNTNVNTTSPFIPTTDGASIGINLINTALGSGNVIIQTATNGANEESGDIIWSPGNYTYSGANSRSLTLEAHRHITLMNSITSTNSSLNLTFTANTGDSQRGIVTVKSDLTTNGGNITFNGVGTVFSGASAQTLSTANGTIDFNGEVILSNTSGITLNTGNGNIGFDGKVNSGNSYALTGSASSWTDARTAARGGSYGSAVGDTYLANVTSDIEMSIISTVGEGIEYWLGGSDVDTEGTWKWMDGPESGQTFWVEGTNATGAKGYNGYNNAYINWNNNEPNNVGGEHYLQVNTQTSPVWNDLPNSLMSLKGIIETNLAASPLTITSGTGTVTFGGTVGSQKALDSLSITAATIAVNGGAVTTENLQTYTGNITLGSASTTLSQTNTSKNFTVVAGKSIINSSGGNATLLIKTTQDIILAAGSSIGNTTATGTFGISLNPRSGDGAIGSLVFNNTASAAVNLYSNGGNITFGGGAGNTDYAIGGNPYGPTTHQDGAYLHTVTLDSRVYTAGIAQSTGGGNISIKSKGYAGALTMHAGGLWTTASTFTTGGGNVTLDTWGQRTSNADNGSWIRYGAYLEGLSISTQGGAISITTPEEAASTPDTGMYLVSSPSMSSGSGNITLTTDRLSLGGTPAITGTGTLTVVPYTAATTIGISGGSGTLSLPATLFSTYFSNGFSGITVGNSTAGTITLGGDTDFNDTLTLVSADNIALNATLNATDQSVTLTGGDGKTVSGAGHIIASGLLLNGLNTTYTLNTASGNNITTIAASGATAVNFKNIGSLTVGTVGATNGVTTTGAATLEANGASADLTLSQPVTTTSGNIVLAAGRNFINSNTSNTGIVSSSGRYFIYSTTPVSSAEGMTSYNKHYNDSYVAGSSPSYASSGNWFIYSIAPVLSVAPANSQTITAGHVPARFTPSYTTGFIDGDTSTIADISGTALFGVDGTGSASGLYGIGAHTVAYISGLSSAIGYQFQDDTTSLNELVVTPDVTATTSGIQSSINGTANTDKTSTPQTENAIISPRIVPGAGSSTIIEFSNNTLVTNTPTTGMQLVTPGSTTPISYTSQGNQLSLNLSTSSNQKTPSVSSNALPVYQADAAGFVSQSAVKVSDTGNRLTVEPASAPQHNLALSDIQTTKQVTSNVSSPGREALKLTVSVTKAGILVVSVPEALFVTTDKQRMILLGIATAKESLGVNVKSLRGIVVKKEDLSL